MMCRHVDIEAEDAFMLQNFSKPEGNEDSFDGTKLVDPIHWYGLLAPQSLKNAQARFVKGMDIEDGLIVVLEESVEVANAMAKLKISESAILALRQKYNSSHPNATAERTITMESPMDNEQETDI